MFENVFNIVLVIAIICLIWFVFKAMVKAAIAIIVVLILLFIGNQMFGEGKNQNFGEKNGNDRQQIVFSCKKAVLTI
jgi:ABC-type bacteriocin/lantibiotic exporter with double-glycine peptidase domain